MPNTIEVELRASAPRVIRRRASHGRFITFLHLFVLPHTVGAIVVIAGLARSLCVEHFGEVQDARVVAIEPFEFKGAARATVRYAVELPGVPHEGSYSTSRAFAAGLGDSVAVRVLRLGPLVQSMPVDPGAQPGFGPMALTVLVFTLVLGPFHWRATWLPLRFKRLVREGVAVTGRLVDRREVRGKGVSHYVTYEYTPDVGQPRRKELWVRKADFEAAQIPSEVTVLYDPRHPGRSVPYVLAPYEALPESTGNDGKVATQVA